MFDQLLPQRIDNVFHGRKLALWHFGVVLAVKILQSVMVVYNGHYIL